MRKKTNAVISVVLSLALALTGISYASLNTEADTVAPIKTITFDSEADIVAANDSAAKIVDDATRGKVISLGAGDANKDLTGAQISNPWADATVNPDAKEYTPDDYKRAYNDALAIPYGEKFLFAPNATTGYPMKGENEGGGVTWKSLTVSTATKTNGAVAEGLETSINDAATGEYKGAEFAQKAMGDTLAATRIKRAGQEIELADGTKAAVSAYKVEKEADYVRPVWEKDDGLTMQFWVNVPEGTTEDTILFSFFNERIVGAFDETAATTFNNTTGHLWVKADGSIEFAELSFYAGDATQTSGGNQISRYAASRNKFQTPAIGKGVNAVSKVGQWVCVTLVCENDFISVYFDGIQANYTELNLPSQTDTDGGKFTQDWENPENSPNWTRSEVSTPVKTFNGWFGSRNTPTHALVNSGIYSSFPKWTSPSAAKMTPCKVDERQGGTTLANQPRITMCQWLQDTATTLYLGGAAGKDMSTWRADETGTETYACVRQYTLAEGTLFDGFEFYDEALTSTEVATAYVNAGGTLDEIPVDPTATPETPVDPTDVPATDVPATDVPATETPAPTATPEVPVDPTATPEVPVDPTATPEVPVDPTATPEVPVDPTATPEVPVDPTATPEVPADPTDTPAPEILIGDVDKDGDIDATDALMVLKHAAKLEILEDTAPAMTNPDDVADALDALNILKVAAKLLDKLPTAE